MRLLFWCLIFESSHCKAVEDRAPVHFILPDIIHWNKNVILTKFSSLAALEVVILTTSSAASDEHFIKMKTFPFQCYYDVTRGIVCHNERLFVQTFVRLTSNKTSKPALQVLCKASGKPPVDSPHKGPVRRKTVPFHVVIMIQMSCKDLTTR